jgi:PIN domain nuclease of toxin-antitoxin system
VPGRLSALQTLPLAVEHAHALRVADLPPHHRDPFDRMLIAQGQLEDMAVVSDDEVFDQYGVRRFW